MSQHMSVTGRSLAVSLLLVAAIGCGAAYADVVERTGKATVEYTSGAFFSSKPSDESKHAAVEKAKRAAWDRYTADFDSSQMKSYKEVETEILHDLDKYIVDYSVADEFVDKESKRYTVVIRASINESAFSETMRGSSVAGSSSAGSGAKFSFVFVAREADGVVAFQNKRTVVSDQETMERERQDESSDAGSVVSGANLKRTSVTATGGSTERKSDKTAYKILSATDFDASMSKVLTDANYKVVKYSLFAKKCHGIELRALQEGFVKTQELDEDAQSSAINAAAECGVRYFAVGTLDASLADVDPVTNKKRVVVAVTAQVFVSEEDLPSLVASVGPIQYAGLGSEPAEARRNALTGAAEKAAQAIVNQLNAKSVR